MKTRRVHLRVYDRTGGGNWTACAMVIGPNSRMALGKAEEVTCERCRRYVDRTGDGPESLKALFRL
jgi:hypothetical protein